MHLDNLDLHARLRNLFLFILVFFALITTTMHGFVAEKHEINELLFSKREAGGISREAHGLLKLIHQIADVFDINFSHHWPPSLGCCS